MGILKSSGCPEYSIQLLQDFLTAVSRSASVFLPETSSLPACSVRTARAVVVVPVVPTTAARSGCERSLGGGVIGRSVGSFRFGSGRLFGWATGARFGSGCRSG